MTQSVFNECVLFQCYAADLYILVKEYGCVLSEYIHRLGGKEPAAALLGAEVIHLGMRR